MIPRSVLASVSASVDYSVPLNKGTLTKLSLIASGVICTENSSEYEIMKEYMQVQTTEGYSVMIKLSGLDKSSGSIKYVPFVLLICHRYVCIRVTVY